MLNRLILTIFLLTSTFVIAQEDMTYQYDGKTFEVLKEIKLKYGDLKAVTNIEDGAYYDVILNGKSIFAKNNKNTEEEYSNYIYYIDPQKIYYINDKEVVLITKSLGGSGTIDSYFFLTVSEKSDFLISKTFEPDNFDEVKVTQNGDKIIVDLGYNNKGKIERAVYHNGQVKILQLNNNNKIADARNCSFLYNSIYVPFAHSQECNEEPSMVGGMHTSRIYVTLNDVNINFDIFEKLSKKACKAEGKGLLKYAEFKKIVCVHK